MTDMLSHARKVRSACVLKEYVSIGQSVGPSKVTSLAAIDAGFQRAYIHIHTLHHNNNHRRRSKKKTSSTHTTTTALTVGEEHLGLHLDRHLAQLVVGRLPPAAAAPAAEGPEARQESAGLWEDGMGK